MDLVVAIVVLCMVSAVGFAAAVAVVFVVARRSLRVAPGVPSAAPVRWLVVPSAPARAHRELRRAAVSAAALVPETSLAPRVSEVAVHLDARLVLSCALPSGARRPAVRAAVADVAVFAALVQHLVASEHPALVRTPSPLPSGASDPELAALMTAARLRAEALASLDDPVSWPTGGRSGLQQDR
jgi:hypothetical protein